MVADLCLNLADLIIGFVWAILASPELVESVVLADLEDSEAIAVHYLLVVELDFVETRYQLVMLVCPYQRHSLWIQCSRDTPPMFLNILF